MPHVPVPPNIDKRHSADPPPPPLSSYPLTTSRRICTHPKIGPWDKYMRNASPNPPWLGHSIGDNKIRSSGFVKEQNHRLIIPVFGRSSIKINGVGTQVMLHNALQSASTCTITFADCSIMNNETETAMSATHPTVIEMQANSAVLNQSTANSTTINTYLLTYT